MKQCMHCHSKFADSIQECSSCGSTNFRNVCNQCTEVFDAPYCPKCGVKAGTEGRKCPQCGTLTFHKHCRECGANVLTPANAPQQVVTPNNQVNNTLPNTPIGRQQIPPSYAPANRNYVPTPPVKHKNRRQQVILIIILLLTFSCYILNMGSGSKNTSAKNNAQDLNAEVLSVYQADGHPVFYDSFSEAESYYNKKKLLDYVQLGDTFIPADAGDAGSAPLMVLKPTATGDKINSIEFLIQNSEGANPQYHTDLDSILAIISEYIPFTVLQTYYENEYAIRVTDSQTNTAAYYYGARLNEVGQVARDVEGTPYDDIFAFKIQYENGKFPYALISSSVWADSLLVSREQYLAEEWDIDITTMLFSKPADLPLAGEQRESQLDLYLLPGHPRLFDSSSDAKTFWSDYSNIYVGTSSGNSKSDLLIAKAESKSKAITKFDFNFYLLNNRDQRHLTLEQVLAILSGYMPSADIIEAYYDLQFAYIVYETAPSTVTYRYYTKLNDKGKNINTVEGTAYSNYFSIEIVQREGIFTNATLGNQLLSSASGSQDYDFWYLDIRTMTSIPVSELIPPAQDETTQDEADV